MREYMFESSGTINVGQVMLHNQLMMSFLCCHEAWNEWKIRRALSSLAAATGSMPQFWPAALVISLWWEPVLGTGALCPDGCYELQFNVGWQQRPWKYWKQRTQSYKLTDIKLLLEKKPHHKLWRRLLWAYQREAAAELERINQAAGRGICWDLRKWHSLVSPSVSMA